MAVIEVTKENFEDEVMKCDKKVLVDFNADWCGPCKMLGPIVEDFSNHHDDVKVVSINIDDEEELAEEYNVFSIPCLVLLEQGKEVKRSVGFLPKDKLERFIGD